MKTINTLINRRYRYIVWLVFLMSLCSCTEKKQESSDCRMHSDCKDDGAICMLEEGMESKCAVLPCKEDKDCGLDDLLCESVEGRSLCQPKECKSPADCSENTHACKQGRCDRRQGVGGSCQKDEHCMEDLICHASKCVYAGNGVKYVTLEGKLLKQEEANYVYKEEEIRNLVYQAGEEGDDSSFATPNIETVDSQVLVEGVQLVIYTGSPSISSCDIEIDTSRAVLKKNGGGEVKLVLGECQVEDGRIKLEIGSKEKIKQGDYTLEVRVQLGGYEDAIDESFSWRVEKHLIYEAKVYSVVDYESQLEDRNIYIRQVCDSVTDTGRWSLRLPVYQMSANNLFGPNLFGTLQTAVRAMADIRANTVVLDTVVDVVWRLMMGKGIYKVPSQGLALKAGLTLEGVEIEGWDARDEWTGDEYLEYLQKATVLTADQNCDDVITLKDGDTTQDDIQPPSTGPVLEIDRSGENADDVVVYFRRDDDSREIVLRNLAVVGATGHGMSLQLSDITMQNIASLLNQEHGIYISTHRELDLIDNIQLFNSLLAHNGGNGILVKDNQGKKIENIQLQGVFQHNKGNGMKIVVEAQGEGVIRNVDIQGVFRCNGNRGIEMGGNIDDSKLTNVRILNSLFVKNHDDGMFVFSNGGNTMLSLFTYGNTVARNGKKGLKMEVTEEGKLYVGLLSNILWGKNGQDVYFNETVKKEHLAFYENVVGKDSKLAEMTFCPEEGSPAIGQGVCCGQRPAASSAEKPETICFRPSSAEITCAAALDSVKDSNNKW